MWNVTGLKEKAREKFQNLTEGRWPFLDLPALVKAVFSTTPPNDPGLRNIIIDIGTTHYKDLIDDDSFITIMNEYGELSVEMLRCTTKNLEDEITKILGLHDSTLEEIQNKGRQKARLKYQETRRVQYKNDVLSTVQAKLSILAKKMLQEHFATSVMGSGIMERRSYDRRFKIYRDSLIVTSILHQSVGTGRTRTVLLSKLLALMCIMYLQK